MSRHALLPLALIALCAPLRAQTVTAAAQPSAAQASPSGLTIQASAGPLTAGVPGELTLTVTNANAAGLGAPSLTVSAAPSLALNAGCALAGLLNTGLAPVGQADPNWSVVSAPSGPLPGPVPCYVFAAPGLDAASGQPGGEASPAAAQATSGNAAPGAWVFQERVTVAGTPPASVAARITADDEIASVTLNGAPQAAAPTTYNVTDSVTLAGWQPGANVVQVTVVNAGNAPNPCGLRVEWGAVTGQPQALPAPGPLALTVQPQILYAVSLPDWVSDLGGVPAWLAGSSGAWYDSADNGVSHTLHVLLPVPAPGSQASVSVPLVAQPAGVPVTPLALSPSALTAP